MMLTQLGDGEEDSIQRFSEIRIITNETDSPVVPHVTNQQTVADQTSAATPTDHPIWITCFSTFLGWLTWCCCCGPFWCCCIACLKCLAIVKTGNDGIGPYDSFYLKHQVGDKDNHEAQSRKIKNSP